MELIDRITGRRWSVTVMKKGRDVTSDCLEEVVKMCGGEWDFDPEFMVEELKKFYNANVRELYVPGIAI